MIMQFDNIGSVGVIKDNPATDLPHQAWTDSSNVRFNNGLIEKFFGHSQVFGTPTVTPYWAHDVWVNETQYWLYASLAKIYITDGGTHNDATRTSGGDYAATANHGWNGGPLAGGVLILNNGVDAPQQWAGTGLGSDCSNLSNWPSGMKAKVVRTYRGFILAGNIDENGGAGFEGELLRWSNQADPGTVPTSWAYADPSVEAGRTIIGTSGEEIVDMVQMQDAMIIYKKNQIWMMQYVGGIFVFSFRSLFDQVGCLAANCVASFHGQHAVLTQDDFIVHNGVQIQQPLPRRWREWLFNNIDPDNSSKSFLTVNYRRNEIWICYPETGSAGCNKALVWNWRDNTLQPRDLPAGTAHIALGRVAGVTNITFDSDSPAFSTLDGTRFNDAEYQGARRYMLLCDAAATKFYRMEETNQFNGSNFSSYVEREALPLGRQGAQGILVDLQKTKYVKRIWARITGDDGGEVTIKLGARDNPEDPINYTETHTYIIGTTEFINTRVMGRLIDIRFENNTNINWVLSGNTVDFEIRGIR